MEYLYKNLSPEEFEELAQDLLSTFLGSKCERFKAGKDKGIDLRLLAKGMTVIAQVKHMPGSFSAKHKASLSKEFTKAQELKKSQKFSRYVLIISANLSAQNKADILVLSEGLIHSENDIIGLEDIEFILSENPLIVRKHFKLWISSTQILMRMLSNRIVGRSDDYMSSVINEKIPLFVETENIQKSIEILNKQHILIVTGEPGIGKTTLSEFLCLYHVGKDFEFIYCESVDDAEEVFTKESKQIFLLDDFLGSNLLETFEGKEESKILRFIRRIKSHSDKFLIMNSRTTLYSQAGMKGIHWNEFNWGAIKYNIDISGYSLIQRAKILYNHLRHRNLQTDYFDAIRESKAYLDIVKHRNFNPRTIEFITTEHRIKDLSKESYLSYVKNALDNPLEIWLPYYREQISNENRWLLQTLFSLKGECEESELSEAFRSRLNFEIKFNGHKATEESFVSSIKSLLDGFIFREMRRTTSGKLITYWRYLNPSVFDFLQSYISKNQDAISSIIKSFVEYKQWDTLLSIPEIKSVAMELRLIDVLHSKFLEFKPFTLSNCELEYLKIIRENKIPISQERLIQLFIQGHSKAKTESDAKELDRLFGLIRELKLERQLKNAIIDPAAFCRHIFLLLARLIDVRSLALEFEMLFDDWNDLSQVLYSSTEIINHLETIVENEAEELVSNSDEVNSATELEEAETAIRAMAKDLHSQIEDLGLEELLSVDSIYSIDIRGIIYDNKKKEERENEDYDNDWRPPERENIDDNISYVFKE